jgi:glycosyltransferase involved in cell wall biosynthesis
MKKKIVFMAPHTNISGGTKTIFTLADRLSDHYDVIVGCHHIFDMSLRWLFEKEPPRFKLVHRSETRLMQDAACIVDYMDGEIDMRIKAPHILFMQGYNSVLKEYNNLGLPFKAVIATSTWLYETARARGHQKVSVIPPGLSDSFINHAGRVPLGESGYYVIGSLYHRFAFKNSRTLITLVRRIKGVPNLSLRLLSAFAPDEKFEMFPPCDWRIDQPESKLISVYDGCAVWVSPSIKEGFGLTTLEAMACGVPTVWVQSGGLDDYMLDGVNCLVVKQRDTLQIGSVIERLLGDVELAQRISIGGQVLARQFTWRRCISDFTGVLEGV